MGGEEWGDGVRGGVGVGGGGVSVIVEHAQLANHGQWALVHGRGWLRWSKLVIVWWKWRQLITTIRKSQPQPPSSQIPSATLIISRVITFTKQSLLVRIFLSIPSIIMYPI